MNRTETTRILTILRTVWPESAVTDDTITAWAWAFEDVPYPAVEAAAKRWIKTGTFFPRPGELLRLVGVAAVAPGLVPEAAWEEVLRETKRVGFNRPPVFHDGRFEPPAVPEFSSPLIAAAANAVGWEAICTSDKPEVVRAQFVKALTALLGRAVERVQTGEAPVALPEPGLPALDGGRS